MEVILRKDVDSLGQAGDIVRVKPGYARNYLIPRGLALLATRGNMSLMEHHQRAIAREQEKIRAERLEVASALEGISVSVARKAGKDGKLFGSVTSKDIVEALAAQNIELDRRLIQLDEPLRAAGTYDVAVRFSSEISVSLKVNVVGI
jgi:large subunit ribosomal protein L9